MANTFRGWCGVILLSAGQAALAQTLPGGAGGGGAFLFTAPDPTVAAPVASARTPLASLRPNQLMTVNAMIGSVNGEPVFVIDLLKPIDEELRRLALTAPTLRAFREQAMVLITNEWKVRRRDTVVMAAAEAALSEKERTGLDTVMEFKRRELREKWGGNSEAEAEKVLKGMNSSLQKELMQLRRDLIVNSYITKAVQHKIQVIREMVLQEYQRDPARWETPAQLELFSITLPITRWMRERRENGEFGPIPATATEAEIKAAEAKAMETAKSIVAELKTGKDFAILAEQYERSVLANDKGGRSTLVKGVLSNTELDAYLFSLPEGAIDIHVTRGKNFKEVEVMVVKVGKKTESNRVTFAEAQSQILLALRRKQGDMLWKDEEARLSRGISVEAVERNLDLVLEAAVGIYATR